MLLPSVALSRTSESKILDLLKHWVHGPAYPRDVRNHWTWCFCPASKKRNAHGDLAEPRYRQHENRKWSSLPSILLKEPGAMIDHRLLNIMTVAAIPRFRHKRQREEELPSILKQKSLKIAIEESTVRSLQNREALRLSSVEQVQDMVQIDSLANPLCGLLRPLIVRTNATFFT